MLHSLLQPEIGQFAQIAIIVFASHKCGGFGDFPVIWRSWRANRRAFDGDAGTANRSDAE
jgi:hypothetical protein